MTATADSVPHTRETFRAGYERRVEEIKNRPPPHPCRSFAPGHKVHWIQARRAWIEKGPDMMKVPGQLTSVTDDGWIDLQADTGEAHRVWHHDPEGLARRISHIDRGLPVVFSLRWCIVELPSPPISISTEPSPCVYEPPSGDLARDITTHGGFLVTSETVRTYLSTIERDRP